MSPKRFAAFIATAQLAFATPAFADCVLPKPPAQPNGSTSTAAEMEAARSALERYRKAIKDYLVCTDEELKKRIAALGNKTDMIVQAKLFAEKRAKSIQDELQTHADEFDDQLRLFKLNNRD